MDFQDNSQAVKAQLEKNIAKTLTALGYKWQEIVTMEINAQPQFGHSQGARVTGKGRTNRPGGGMGAVDTGRLRGSMEFEVDTANKQVIVGTDVEYAPYVFMGTWKMPARPALQNSALDYANDYQAIAEDILNL